MRLKKFWKYLQDRFSDTRTYNVWTFYFQVQVSFSLGAKGTDFLLCMHEINTTKECVINSDRPNGYPSNFNKERKKLMDDFIGAMGKIFAFVSVKKLFWAVYHCFKIFFFFLKRWTNFNLMGINFKLWSRIYIKNKFDVNSICWFGLFIYFYYFSNFLFIKNFLMYSLLCFIYFEKAILEMIYSFLKPKS